MGRQGSAHGEKGLECQDGIFLTYVIMSVNKIPIL